MKVGFKGLVLVGMLLSLTSCLSLAPRGRDASSTALENDAVPARRWADNRCAAGALSEVLNSLGDPVTEDQLNESLPKGRSGGVVTVDLLLAARARGFDAQIVKGDLDLVARELQQDHPLILMLRVMDAPGAEDDLFHYVVLTGLDPKRELVRMHYGDGRRRWVDLRPLQKSWAAGGNATFLISARKGQVAGEDDLRRAVVLEDAGKLDEAVALYRFFLRSHPESAVAWTNLANTHAALGEIQLAEAEYRNVLFLDPDHFEALNNLAWMLLGQRRLEEAETLARRAVARDVPDRAAAVDTLEKILDAKEASDREQEKRRGGEEEKSEDSAVQRPGNQTGFHSSPSEIPLLHPGPETSGLSSGNSPRRAGPYWKMYGLLTAATIFDVEATFYRLSHCLECQEGNPILRPLVEEGRLATYLFSGIVNGVIMQFARRMYDSGNPWWRLAALTFTVVHGIAGVQNLSIGANEGT